MNLCFKAFIYFALISLQTGLVAQETIAMKWSEQLLEAIRNDFARPTVHARNLFHISAGMYDAWAVYHPENKTYFLNDSLLEYDIPFDTSVVPVFQNRDSAAAISISHVAFRLIEYRFKNSPKAELIEMHIRDLMDQLGYDYNYREIDYIKHPNAASIGNYIAQMIIDFCSQDGANEIDGYKNLFYQPVNPPLYVGNKGNPNLPEPGRWQPLGFDLFIDQGGNHIVSGAPSFLGAEWGRVIPFALDKRDLKILERNNNEYWVYHDPGPPPSNPLTNQSDRARYIKEFTMVLLWSSHLDAANDKMIDISPRGFGNLSKLPSNQMEYDNFYKYFDGGDKSLGRTMNPRKGKEYESQFVKLGDYARVLAEFWADGPSSETPPGHWFTILNKVLRDPDFSYRWQGKGEEYDKLEFQLKSYFTLGATVHDAAVSVWGIKGYYDFVRPVSAIRHMATKGQSSDQTLPNYNILGLPLIPGYIEVISATDSLAKVDKKNIGKIKAKAWRGPDFIKNPDTDIAGVGWTLAESWWPYQRPTFVSPPFAGYVSGHSCFSRAAAEIMTMITGDEYFPGGIGEFNAPKNEFLVFEEGPSKDIKLQWATYRDASDQTSLSRIWGGIHPGVDDIPGRLIGIVVANDVWNKVGTYFESKTTTAVSDIKRIVSQNYILYPNPIVTHDMVTIKSTEARNDIRWFVYDQSGNVLNRGNAKSLGANEEIRINLESKVSGMYYVHLMDAQGGQLIRLSVVK